MLAPGGHCGQVGSGPVGTGHGEAEVLTCIGYAQVSGWVSVGADSDLRSTGEVKAETHLGEWWASRGLDSGIIVSIMGTQDQSSPGSRG